MPAKRAGWSANSRLPFQLPPAVDVLAEEALRPANWRTEVMPEDFFRSPRAQRHAHAPGERAHELEVIAGEKVTSLHLANCATSYGFVAQCKMDMAQ